jgi:hypothetical protein
VKQKLAWDLDPLIHGQPVKNKERNPILARASAQSQIPWDMMDHHRSLRCWKGWQVSEVLKQPVFQPIICCALHCADLIMYWLSNFDVQTIESADDFAKPASHLHPISMR